MAMKYFGSPFFTGDIWGEFNPPTAAAFAAQPGDITPLQHEALLQYQALPKAAQYQQALASIGMGRYARRAAERMYAPMLGMYQAFGEPVVGGYETFGDFLSDPAGRAATGVTQAELLERMQDIARLGRMGGIEKSITDDPTFFDQYGPGASVLYGTYFGEEDALKAQRRLVEAHNLARFGGAGANVAQRRAAQSVINDLYDQYLGAGTATTGSAAALGGYGGGFTTAQPGGFIDWYLNRFGQAPGHDSPLVGTLFGGVGSSA